MKFVILTCKAKLAAGLGVLAGIVLTVSAVSLRVLGKGHQAFLGYVCESSARVALANDVPDAANPSNVSARNHVRFAGPSHCEAGKTTALQTHRNATASASRPEAMGSKGHNTGDQERWLVCAVVRAESCSRQVRLAPANAGIRTALQVHRVS